MKNQKIIFGCLAGIMFMAFVAMNLTVSWSYQGNEMAAQLTLTELAAQAQGGDECVFDLGHCFPNGCSVWSWDGINDGGPDNHYKWYYTGCQHHCTGGGTQCCYDLTSYGCN